MIKARGVLDGETFYAFGLSENNLAQLVDGAPIYFAGDEIQLPRTWVLIAHVPRGRKPNEERARYALGTPRDHKLVIVPITDQALHMLRHDASHAITCKRDVGLPGTLWVLYGETEEAMTQRFAKLTNMPHAVAPPAPHERVDMDPITGQLKRSPLRPN